MPNQYPHFVFKNSVEGQVTFKYSKRGVNKEPTGEGNANVPASVQIVSFKESLENFQRGLAKREQERNAQLQVSVKITNLEIEFHSEFYGRKFEVYYLANFGLSAVKYSYLNTRGTFAVSDRRAFEYFLQQFKNFEACQDHSNPTYDKHITFIKSFDYLSTEYIIKNQKRKEDIVYVSLLDNIDIQNRIQRLRKDLEAYLNQRAISYFYNPVNHCLEIKGITPNEVLEIAQNFDNIHAICAASFGLIKPGIVGTPIREFPFSIASPSPTLPIIGVIDTGVSDQTPLKELLLNQDNSFHISNGNPRVDDNGHGTAVAALAALGDQLKEQVTGKLNADARILSIKVLDGSSGYLSNQDIIFLIRKAYRDYQVRLFTLTICYENPLKSNESHSEYALLLDKLAYELDILIFISIGNYEYFDRNTIEERYPRHFLVEETNLKSPSESMNNMTIGAIGDNLEPALPSLPEKRPLSDGILPAAYSRKYHIDYAVLKNKNNKIFKPDVVFAGGNYTLIRDDPWGFFYDDRGDAALNLLGIGAGSYFERGVGTSYATPLVANIAAKILKQFPSLRLQTVKALIINSAEPIPFGDYEKILKEHHQRFLAGNGIPSLQKCLYSGDNEVTFIIEDTIQEGTVKCFPMNLPSYLNKQAKDKALLKIEATLCFKFNPVPNNQIGYCPINISFGIFKNLPLEDSFQEIVKGRKLTVNKGINGAAKDQCSINGKNGQSWSQDAYPKGKLLSNSQKLSINVSRQDIISEGNTFKIAINAHFHKILAEHIIEGLDTRYEYSLVVRIKDNQTEYELSDQLYKDIQLVNTLEVLAVADLDNSLEAELEN